MAQPTYRDIASALDDFAALGDISGIEALRDSLPLGRKRLAAIYRADAVRLRLAGRISEAKHAEDVSEQCLVDNRA